MLLLVETNLRIKKFVLFVTSRKCGRFPNDSIVSVVEVHEDRLQRSELGILASIFQWEFLREVAVTVFQ